MSTKVQLQRSTMAPGNAASAGPAAVTGGEVQLKRDLRGKGFDEQAAMLAPGAARETTTVGEEVARAPGSPLAVQMKAALGVLPEAEAIQALEVPAPSAGAPVQMSPDPAAPAAATTPTTAPGTAPATTTAPGAATTPGTAPATTTAPGAPTTAPGAAPGTTAAPGAEAAAAPGAAAVDPAKDTQFGKPYDNVAEGMAAEAWLTAFFLPAITAAFGVEVGSIWRAYLARKPGDSLVPRKYGKGDAIGDAFIRNPITHYATQVVMDAAQTTVADPGFAQTLAQRLKPGEWVDFDVSEVVADPSALPINYANAGDIPGHLAGGVSGSDAGPDSRSVSGPVQMFSHVSPDKPNEIDLEVRPAFQFHVADAVDFIPGGPGAGIEQRFTVPLSRLEASGMAYDVPFVVDFPAPDTRINAPLPEAIGREKNVQDVLEVAGTFEEKGFVPAGKLLAEKAHAYEQARLAALAQKAREVRDSGYAALEHAAGAAADKVFGLVFGGL